MKEGIRRVVNNYSPETGFRCTDFTETNEKKERAREVPK
jgi:hypothetical protein